MPYGGYPCAVYRHYDYDPVYLRAYAEAAKDDDAFTRFQEKYVYGVKNHQELMRLVGKKRLEAIQSDERTGYAVNLKRG